MSKSTFGVDTAFPPPPQPPVPGWPPPHQPPPPGPPGASNRRRRGGWALMAAAGVAGAVLASTVAAVVTLQARDTGSTTATSAPTPITVTVSAPSSPAPDRLPAGEANSQTCRQGWVAAGNLIQSAQTALRVLPPNVKVGDPAATSDPRWSTTVLQAADLYGQASSALEADLAPGTTPVLAEAARTSVRALRLLGDAIRTSDPATGNVVAIANESTKQTGVLCDRLG